MRKAIKYIQILNIASYPGALLIMCFFVYPIVKEGINNYHYILIWFAAVGIGFTYLNHRFLSIMGQAKETANVKDLFSSMGRVKVKQNPDAYFTPEVYKQYKQIFLFMFVYIAIAMAVFMAIFLIFIRPGQGG